MRSMRVQGGTEAARTGSPTLCLQRVVVVNFQSEKPGGPGAPKSEASFLRVVKGLQGARWGGVERSGPGVPQADRVSEGVPDGKPTQPLGPEWQWVVWEGQLDENDSPADGQLITSGGAGAPQSAHCPSPARPPLDSEEAEESPMDTARGGQLTWDHPVCKPLQVPWGP